MNIRLDKLRQAMKQNGLDGVFIYSKENRRYLSGFTGSTGYIVISGNKAVFITDFRYIEQAQEQCAGYEIIDHKGSLYDVINKTAESLGIKKLGIEDGFMTVSFYETMKNSLSNIELTSLKDIMENIRIIKDDNEIECIAKAADYGDMAFEHIINYIKPGMTERQVELELDYFIKKISGNPMSFEAIVVSGIRSSLPHGEPSDKVINNGEFLTLDFGCVYNGYCSDMTRTVFVGKANDEHKKIYSIVLRAQNEALKYIKAGIPAKDVDKIARDIITNEGYGERFGHGLGHGVGLAVHEEPRVGVMGTRTLEAGMIITDEPGIYIPDFGGVRIEDLVLVQEDGCRVFTKSPKHLIEI
jgi:Xaa-Pro aminopeptidase